METLRMKNFPNKSELFIKINLVVTTYKLLHILSNTCTRIYDWLGFIVSPLILIYFTPLLYTQTTTDVIRQNCKIHR